VIKWLEFWKGRGIRINVPIWVTGAEMDICRKCGIRRKVHGYTDHHFKEAT